MFLLLGVPRKYWPSFFFCGCVCKGGQWWATTMRHILYLCLMLCFSLFLILFLSFFRYYSERCCLARNIVCQFSRSNTWSLHDHYRFVRARVCILHWEWNNLHAFCSSLYLSSVRRLYLICLRNHHTRHNNNNNCYLMLIATWIVRARIRLSIKWIPSVYTAYHFVRMPRINTSIGIDVAWTRRTVYTSE